LVSAGVLAAQKAPVPVSARVRYIEVKPVSTNSTGLKEIGSGAIAATLKREGIDLAVERTYDPVAVAKAADVIRDLYGGAGQKVRVEYTVTQIPPGASVGVAFEVIQLCACN